VRRGELWRFAPVVQRPGQSTIRLIVSSDPINSNPSIRYVLAVHVLQEAPESLLSVELAPHGWAMVPELDRALKRQLVARLASVTPEQMQAVNTALRALLDLP
jgi:mRNA-degrading endonuclease toxin of MazEF toxin-antitoxin module